MSTPIVNTDREPLSEPIAQPRLLWDAGLWALGSLIAMFLARLVRDAETLGETYLPSTNDSFYHARRVLDAAFGQDFYQFDPRLHAPDGAWIPWPWAYDYLLAKATQLTSWLDPSLDPMAFLTYVPVAWVLVNAALFVAVCRAIGLSFDLRVLATLSFAISPLTQLLHAAGMVDHHYIEHTFVLLTLWLGLRWFERPDDERRALLLGLTLGIAPAFHNGLFILQLLPLATVFVTWLRGTAPHRRPLLAFGLGLVGATQIVLIPSEPYRQLMFEFGLLSWFHIYVALCTAAATAYMGWRAFSPRSLAGLVGLCALLALPLVQQLAGGAGFLSKDFSILSEIREARSLLEIARIDGIGEVVGYYSWLVVLIPVLLAYYGQRIFRERSPSRLYYAIAVVAGLAMLLSQQRLQYFGFVQYATCGLLLIDAARKHARWHRGATFVATFALIVIAYQPALRERLFLVYAPGADSEYAGAYSIFMDLQALCREDPGVVLASADDGNPILYHSDCSVIANNFILRQEDATHIDEVDRLMRLSPADIVRERPDVKYVIVRARDFSTLVNGELRLVEQNQIAKQLLIDDRPPAGYTLIRTVRQTASEQSAVFARLYEIVQ